MGLSVSVEVWIISVVGHWTLDIGHLCHPRSKAHCNFPSQIEIFADFFYRAVLQRTIGRYWDF